MSTWKYKPKLTSALVVSLALLLVVLAFLQFREISGLSGAGRKRMQESIRAGAIRFSDEVDNELTRAYISFQVDADSLENGGTPDLAERYGSWSRAASFPGIVSQVYWMRVSDRGEPELMGLDSKHRSLTHVSWPNRFAELKERLRQENSDPA
ncbi:MAG: hypothetical protein ACREDR_36385, partial [Blastocatellia bacterium]